MALMLVVIVDLARHVFIPGGVSIRLDFAMTPQIFSALCFLACVLSFRCAVASSNGELQEINGADHPTPIQPAESSHVAASSPEDRRRLLMAWHVMTSTQERRNARVQQARLRSARRAARFREETQAVFAGMIWHEHAHRLHLIRLFLHPPSRIPRTVIPRCSWRESTIFQYMHGTASVFRANFRYTRRSFRLLMDLIRNDLTTEYDPVDPRWESQQAAQL